MNRFEIGEPVWYEGKKAIVADRMRGHLYALWDLTGKKELDCPVWVDEDSLSKREEVRVRSYARRG